MSYTSLIQHLKRLADSYVPKEPYYLEMHPIPKNSESLKSHHNNPDLSPQKPLKGIIIRRAPFVSLFIRPPPITTVQSHALKISPWN